MSHGSYDPDFDFEPVPGLPARLPAGETMLWQGSPDWKTLAVQVFKLRWFAVYFGIAIVWMIGSAINDGRPVLSTLPSILFIVGCGVLGMGIFTLIAWLIGRSTIYTITSKRLVMRFGIALPITINLPFTVMESAALSRIQGEIGDVSIALKKGERIAFLMLWPHTRPWKLRAPQPMLRCLPDAPHAAAIFARAIAAVTPNTVISPIAEEQRPQRDASTVLQTVTG